jgi:hypothetical protein
MMECRDAQFYLRLRRQTADELGTEVTADLDRHLAACPHCADDARLVARFDAAVAVVMQAVPVPAGLRERLVAKLSAQRGATLRRKAYRYVGVAAAFLLTVGLGFGAFWQSRPTLDTQMLVMNQDEQADPDKTEAKVRAWLAENRLPDHLPEPFDYRLYVFHGTDRVQGREVPVVLFRSESGIEFAKVYAFRDTQFDLKDVQPAQASHWQAKVYPDARGVTFVVVFTGRDLDPFLRTGKTANG